MLIFHDIHLTVSILFPDDVLRKLGKFLTTLHSSNSSSDCCYHCIEHSLSFYHYAIHWLTFQVDGHSLLYSFGYDPLSYFIISVVFSPMSEIARCIFSTFLPYHIGFVCLPQTSQMVSWISEMKGLNSSAHGYHALFIFWEMSVNLGRLQVPKLKGVITLLIFPNA